MKRRPKDRSNWGDRAFKAMTERGIRMSDRLKGHREGGAAVSDDTLHGKPWEDLDTHPPGDWAETRAREWLEETLGPVVVQHAYHQFSDTEVSSLAALLREIGKEQWIAGAAADKAALLAQVRRVVESVQDAYTQPTAGCSDAPLACDEILAKLEKLPVRESRNESGAGPVAKIPMGKL